MKNSLSTFTSQYSLSKTLRFELKPIGKTSEWIEKHDIIGVKDDKLIGKDAERAKNYKYAKRMIDEMHRVFIEDALGSLRDEDTVRKLEEQFNKLQNLKEYKVDKDLKDLFKTILDETVGRWIEAYQKDMPTFWRDDLADLESKLAAETNNQRKKGFRSAVSAINKKLKDPEKVFKKKTIDAMYSNEDVLSFLEWKIRAGDVVCTYKDLDQGDSNEPIPIPILCEYLRDFNKFTTYFSGFNENRQNVYDLSGDKSTSIISRIVKENLAFHFANLAKWETVKKSLASFSETFAEKGFNPGKLLEEVESCLGFSAKDFFTVKGFCRSMNQSGIDRYNEIIGGRPALDGSRKVQGINEFINLCRQQAGAKRREFPPLRILYKQILSKSDRTFIPEFSDDQDLLQAIDRFHNDYFIAKDQKGQTLFEKFLDDTAQLAAELIKESGSLYLPAENIPFLSKLLTGHWRNINDELLEKLGEKEFNKRKFFTFAEITKAIEAGVQKAKNQKDAGVQEVNFKLDEEYADCNLIEVLKKRFQSLLNIAESTWRELDKSGVLKLQKLDVNRTNEDDKGFKQIALIKGFLDNAVNIARAVRDWLPNKEILKIESRNRVWIDHLDSFTARYQVIGLYNMTRNYLTKRPTATEKVKITFDKSTLLKGFVDSHTSSDNATQYCGYLFRKLNKQFSEYEYFLGVSSNPKLFRCHLQSEVQKNDQSEYERLEYYQPKGTTFFSSQYSKNKEAMIEVLRKALNEIGSEKSVYSQTERGRIKEELEKILKTDSKGEVTPSAIIDRINKGKYFKGIWVRADVHDILSETIQEMKKYSMTFIDRNPLLQEIQKEDYSGHNGYKKIISDLQKVAVSSKVFNYFPVSQKELDFAANNADKPLYLFRIHNKDLGFCQKAQKGQRSQQSRGRDNLHTMYFKALLSGEQNTFDLGKGELFFRKSSLKRKNTFSHNAEEVLKHKAFSSSWKKLGSPVPEILKWSDLNRFGDKIKIIDKQVLFENQVIGRKCEYPIYKDKRLTKHKYFLHLSTILNYAFDGVTQKLFNENIMKFLKNNPDINIIGIDRGEKHLLYYSVIDQHGEILEQGSLNEIANGFIPRGETGERKVDYHAKLNAVEKKRDKARKSWSMIENIKELKSGYLSQVVHQLSKLIIQHNAIVVLEDLNIGFKRGRFKVEKQIYQKFERALIEKLNYLVFKEAKQCQTGHYLNGYQLTNKFESFKKIGQQKQSGILFYTTASYTSTTDPVTGFLKNLYVRYQNVEKSVELWKSFDAIVYNPTEDRFEFTYTIGKVASKSMNKEKNEDVVKRKTWTVCSCVTRSRYIKAQEKQNENQKQNSSSEQIGNKGRHEIFFVTDELKTHLTENGINYKDCLDLQPGLIAKSAKSDASFHKSMTYYLNAILSLRVTDDNHPKGTPENDYILSPVTPFFDSRYATDGQPESGDANGAYNIARKGICILDKINEAEDLSKVNPAVTKQEWQNFAQK